MSGRAAGRCTSSSTGSPAPTWRLASSRGALRPTSRAEAPEPPRMQESMFQDLQPPNNSKFIVQCSLFLFDVICRKRKYRDDEEFQTSLSLLCTPAVICYLAFAICCCVLSFKIYVLFR